MGITITSFIQPQARQLQLKDPQIFNIYRKNLEVYFKGVSVHEKVAGLSYNMGDKSIEEEIVEYEAIDRVREIHLFQVENSHS